VNALRTLPRVLRSIPVVAFAAVIGMALGATPARAQQLYSNGPLASVPGAGANGSDASRLQNSLGMTTLGFSAKINGTFIQAVADDFTVPAGGWNVSRITVFAYQTDSSLASPLVDLRLLIFDGPPDLPTSSVVFGNPAINALAATSFTNVYRDSESNPGLSRRPIMSAAANVNAFLPAGTYWLAWGLAGSLSDGPYIPPVTIVGQATTGNGLQLCTCSGWQPANDQGTGTRQAFPFVIEGVPAGGTAPASLTVNVTPSSLRAGDRLVVSAALNGSGPTRYDAYVLIDVPGGGVYSITPGGPVPGVVPYARGFTAATLGGVLLDLILPPVPLGTYMVRSYLTLTGTSTPVTAVGQAPFSVVP
jgi:hypothetical protein